MLKSGNLYKISPQRQILFTPAGDISRNAPFPQTRFDFSGKYLLSLFLLGNILSLATWIFNRQTVFSPKGHSSKSFTRWTFPYKQANFHSQKGSERKVCKKLQNFLFHSLDGRWEDQFSIFFPIFPTPILISSETNRTQPGLFFCFFSLLKRIYFLLSCAEDWMLYKSLLGRFDHYISIYTRRGEYMYQICLK